MDIRSQRAGALVKTLAHESPTLHRVAVLGQPGRRALRRAPVVHYASAFDGLLADTYAHLRGVDI